MLILRRIVFLAVHAGVARPSALPTASIRAIWTIFLYAVGLAFETEELRSGQRNTRPVSSETSRFSLVFHAIRSFMRIARSIQAHHHIRSSNRLVGRCTKRGWTSARCDKRSPCVCDCTHRGNQHLVLRCSRPTACHQDAITPVEPVHSAA